MQSNLVINCTGISFSSIRMLIGAFSVIWLLNKGLSLAEIGWIKSFQGFVLVFIDIPLSHYSDRYSRKLSVCLSVIFASVWLLLTGLGSSFLHFITAEFFNALSLGLMSGTFSAWLYDRSKEANTTNTAISIFSKYQRNSYFFMSLFSLIGAFIYQKMDEYVWIISSVLMMLTFFFSLCLPADRKPACENNENLISLFKSLFKIFFKNELCLFSFLYSSLLLAVALQILIQYWQVLITPGEIFSDNKLFYGIVFSLVLLSQAASGYLVGKVKNKKTILLFIIMSALAPLFFSYYFSEAALYSVISVCCMFFSISVMASICNAKLVEISPNNLRSTIISAAAVASKILMFLVMPIVAVIISYLGVRFNILVCIFILIMSFFFLVIYKEEVVTP